MKTLLPCILPLVLAVSACATPSTQPIIQVQQEEGRPLNMPKKETKAKDCKKVPSLGGVQIQCEKFMLAASDIAYPGTLEASTRQENIRISKEGMLENGYTLKREGDQVTFKVNQRDEAYERFVFAKEGTLFTVFFGFAFVGDEHRMMTCMFQESVPAKKAQQMCPKWLTQVSLYAHELRPGKVAIKGDVIEIPKPCKLGDQYIKCREQTQTVDVVWQEFREKKSFKRALRVAKDNAKQFKADQGWGEINERTTECDFAGNEMECIVLNRYNSNGQALNMFIMNGYLEGRYIYVNCMTQNVDRSQDMPALCSEFFTLEQITRAI